MLQSRTNSPCKLLWVIISAAFLLSSCRSATSTDTEEEAMYMADYEASTDKWGFINRQGTLVINARYDDVGPFSEGMAAVNIEGKWGYIDTTGKLLIKPQFRIASAFHENHARVRPFDLPERFMDRNGKTIASEEWAAADDFTEGLARVKVGNMFGYLDTTGQMVIKPIYTQGRNFTKGITVVEYDGKLGVIHASGLQVLPHDYDRIKVFPDAGIILCRRDHISFAFDLTGKALIELEDITMVDTDGLLISIRKEDKMFLYDLQMKRVNPHAAYSNIIYLGSSRWAGKKDNGYYLLDHNGKRVSGKPYTQINRFSDDIAAFNDDGYWGYLDIQGSELTGKVFGLTWDYKDGMARAAFEDGIAFIDTQQKLAFYPPPNTLDMRDFSEGLAPVKIAR